MTDTPYLTTMDTDIFDYLYTFLITNGPMTVFDRKFHNHTKTLSKASRARIDNVGGLCSYLCFDHRFRISQGIVSIVEVEQHDDSPIENLNTTVQDQLEIIQSIRNQCSLNPRASEFIPLLESHSSVLPNNATNKQPRSNTVNGQLQISEEENIDSAPVVSINKNDQSSTTQSKRNDFILHSWNTSDRSLSQHAGSSTSLSPWDDNLESLRRPSSSLYTREQLLTSDGGDDESLFLAAPDTVRSPFRPKDDIPFCSVRIPPKDSWLNQDPWRHSNALEASCEERILNLDHLILQSDKSWPLTSLLQPGNNGNTSIEDSHANTWTSLTTSEDDLEANYREMILNLDHRLQESDSRLSLSWPLQPSNSGNTSIADNHATPWPVPTTSENASSTSYMHSLLDRTNTHTPTAARLNKDFNKLSMNESLPECSLSGSSSSPEQVQLQQGYAENKQELQTMCMEHSVTKDTLDSFREMIREKTMLVDELKMEISRLNVDFLTSQTAEEMWKKTGTELLREHNDLQASSQAQIYELKRQLELEKCKSREASALGQRNYLQGHYNNVIYAHSDNRTPALASNAVSASSNIGTYARTNRGTHTHCNNGPHRCIWCIQPTEPHLLSSVWHHPNLEN